MYPRSHHGRLWRSAQTCSNQPNDTEASLDLTMDGTDDIPRLFDLPKETNTLQSFTRFKQTKLSFKRHTCILQVTPFKLHRISKRGPIFKLCDKQKAVTKVTSKNDVHLSMKIRWFIRALCVVRASKIPPGTWWSTCCEILNLQRTLSQEKVKQNHNTYNLLNFDYL